MTGLTRCPGVAGEGCSSMLDPSTGRTRCNLCQRDHERLHPEEGEPVTTPAIRRSQALAADLARRSAERRQAEEGETPSHDSPKGDEPTWNDLIRQPSQRQLDAQKAAHERLFGSPPEEGEPPTKPQGDADGGKGEAEDATYEDVWTEEGPQRMRVYDLNNLDHETEDNQ